MTDLPGVRPRLDVNADDILSRVFHELDRRKLPYVVESIDCLDFERFEEFRGEWIPAPCPREVFDIMRMVR